MPDAVPTIFPNLPAYLSKQTPPERKSGATSTERQAKENAQLQRDIDTFFDDDQIASLDSIKTNLHKLTIPSEIEMIFKDNTVVFAHLHSADGFLHVKLHLQIDEDLKVQMTVNNLKVHNKEVKHLLFDDKVVTYSSVSNILSFLKSKENMDHHSTATVQNCIDTLSELTFENSEKQRKIQFIVEQLSLLTKTPSQRKYSSDLLAASMIWKTTSPNLYGQLLQEKVLTLPSLSHLRRLSQMFTTDIGMTKAALTYISMRIKDLMGMEKIMILIIDEIHSAQRVEYAGGKVYGIQEGSVCKTVLSFMLKSLAGSYSDVVALYPVNNLDSNKLEQTFTQVMTSLAKIDIVVQAVSVDNATPNRRFYVKLCQGDLQVAFDHPTIPNDKLFLLFDSVHNFKNIFNNFNNRKEFVAPDFEGKKMHANFSHIEALYEFELGKPVKMAYKLSEKVLHPSAIEKTNVMLADSLFHDSTINALKFYGQDKNPEWEKTALFLEEIRKWWNAVNVKNPLHGPRKRDARFSPLSENDWTTAEYLNKFANWLEKWQEGCKGKDPKMKGLTSETFLAMIQTTRGLVKASAHLIEDKGYSYLGKFQSDPLERRFGWYRQLCGANYFISVRQIVEAEKSIRVKSLLKFSGVSLEAAKQTYGEIEQDDTTEIEQSSDLLLAILDKEQLDCKCDKSEDKNIMFFITCYAARSIARTLKCEACVSLIKEDQDMPLMRIEEEAHSSNHRQFVDQINRGGLSYPTDLFFTLSLHVWCHYQDIAKNKEAKQFLLESCDPQKVFLTNFLCLFGATTETRNLCEMKCKNEHSFHKIVQQLVVKLFNCFMKNMCAEVNSEVHCKRKGKSSMQKRKISKLQSNASRE